MNIQDLKSNTTWQEASNTINNNNNKISLAIATLENAKLKNKGYFTTVEKLNEAIPNPTIGSKAYVGTSEPYAIYIVENGVWVDSGYTGGDEIVAKITTDRIEDGAVTSEKIATSAFDSTLSVSGKIAPADVVGTKLSELEGKVSEIDTHINGKPSYIEGKALDINGQIQNDLNYCISQRIPVAQGQQVSVTATIANLQTRIIEYNEEGVKMEFWTITSNLLTRVFTPNVSTSYIIVSFDKNDDNVFAMQGSAEIWRKGYTEGIDAEISSLNTEVSAMQSKVDENTTSISQINNNIADNNKSIAQINTTLEEHTESINAKITTDRIENGAVTSEKIATSVFDSTLSVSGKIAPADVVGSKLSDIEKKVNGDIMVNFFQGGYANDGSPSVNAIRIRTSLFKCNGDLIISHNDKINGLYVYKFSDSTPTSSSYIEHLGYPASGVIKKETFGDNYISIVFANSEGISIEITPNDAKGTSFTDSSKMYSNEEIDVRFESLLEDIKPIQDVVLGRSNYEDDKQASSSGEVLPKENYCLSEFIELPDEARKAGIIVFHGSISGVAITLYDSSKKLLDFYNASPGSENRPLSATQVKGAIYARLCFAKGYEGRISISGNTIWKAKTGITITDTITLLDSKIDRNIKEINEGKYPIKYVGYAFSGKGEPYEKTGYCVTDILKLDKKYQGATAVISWAQEQTDAIVQFISDGVVIDYFNSIINETERTISIPRGATHFRICALIGRETETKLVVGEDTLYPVLVGGLDNLLERVVKLENPETKPYLPSYYFPYLDEKINEVEQYWKGCSSDTCGIFFITDIHFSTSYLYNAGHSIDMIEYMMRTLPIDTIVNGGDLFNDGSYHNFVNDISKQLNTKRIYSTYGNHEFLNYNTYNVVAYYNTISNGMVYGDVEKRWGYVDDVDKKIRFINLCSFGERMQETGSYTNPLLLDEQYNWFVNKALNVPEGFKAIVYTHSLYCGNDQTKVLTKHSGADRYINAIDENKDNMICVLIGHTHWDKIHIGTTGVPYVISQSDRRVPIGTEGVWSDINVDRTIGTTNEQHFEVVVIDKTNRTIRFFAIGSQSRDGYDDEIGELCNYRDLNY